MKSQAFFELVKEKLNMPLMKCVKNGKSGWKWGSSGTCYIGKTGKTKAAKQGAAIEASKKNK